MANSISFLMLYPPVADPYAPYLSLPELSAVLKDNGFECHCLDLNVLAHEELLTGKAFEAELKNALSQSQTHPKYRYQYNKYYDKAKEEFQLQVLGPFLSERLDKAKRTLREKDIYTFNEEGKPLSDRFFFIFNRARKIFFQSPLIHPFLSHSDQAFFLSKNDVLAAVKLYDKTIYKKFFHKKLKELVDFSPSVVGINITYAEQFIPAILAALESRILWPETTIIIGGNYPTVMQSSLEDFPELFKIVDGIACGAGESLLLGVGDNIRNSMPWYYKQNSLIRYENDSIIKPLEVGFWDIKKSPPPNYDDFMSLPYFSAYGQLSYATARGCYWGKCDFCDYPASHYKFILKPIEQVIRDLSFLIERYGVRGFYITDNSVAPGRILKIAEGCLENQLKLNWWCFCRFELTDGWLWSPDEIQTIILSGCYKLFMGGESVSGEILKKSDKGVDVEIIKKIITDIEKTELRAHISFIFGYPGETFDSSKKTVEWALNIARKPRLTSWVQPFRLCRRSRIGIDQVDVIWEDSDLTNLSINIPDYRDRNKTVEEQQQHRDEMEKLTRNFLERYFMQSYMSYPEYHNCAGIQYHLASRENAQLSQNQIITETTAPHLLKLCSSIAFGLIDIAHLTFFNDDAKRCCNKSVNLVLYDMNVDRYLVLSCDLYDWIKSLEFTEDVQTEGLNELYIQDRDTLLSTLINDNWLEKRH